MIRRSILAPLRSLFSNGSSQGRIQPEVEGGGAICRVGAKNIVKSRRAGGAQKFYDLSSGKILWFFN